MRAIIALATKDLRLQLRDRLGFFFTFVFPLIFATFFGTIFSGSGGSSAIQIALVDEDHSEASAGFVAALEKGDELNVTIMADRAGAEDVVRKGNMTAVVIVPAGFGKSDLFSGQAATVIVGVDPARKAEAGMLQGLITQRLFMRLQEVFGNGDAMQAQARKSIESLRDDPDAPAAVKAALLPFLESVDRLGEQLPALASDDNAPETESASGGWQPFRIDSLDIIPQQDGPTNAYAISFPQAVLWAIIACAASFAMSMVTERTRGTLMRLRVAPVSRAQILGGKAVACFITIVAATLLLLLIAHAPPFNVRIRSWLLLAIAVPCIAAGFVGIMMLLSVVGKTEAAASGVSWAVLMILSMIGGGMVPLFVMPGWMRMVSSVSPVKWSILALEGAIWRPFTLTDMVLPCGILLGLAAIGFVAGSIGFARGDAA